MSNKRRHPGRVAGGVRRQRWQQRLLPITIVPMILGLLLIVGAALSIVPRGTPDQQALTGGILILLGFAGSNALQGHPIPAAGWAVLGLSAGAWAFMPAATGRTVALVLAAAAFALLIWEFARRLSKTVKARS